MICVLSMIILNFLDIDKILKGVFQDV